MSSSLLSPSESLAFNGFLSSVDVSDVLEWSNAHAQLAETLQPARGKEALAKATKDLMSMEASDLSFATGHHGIVDNEKHGDSLFMNSGPATTTQRFDYERLLARIPINCPSLRFSSRQLRLQCSHFDLIMVTTTISYP